MASARPPRLLDWWEARSIPAQILGAGIPLVLTLWLAHVVLLNQPVWRGLGYGFFWGAIATGAVVGASRSERARRERPE